MDLLGPLNETKQGYKYILLVIDPFRKFPEAFPNVAKEATEGTMLFYDGIICRYGVSRSILTDKGQCFMSKVVTELCRIFWITKINTCSYNAQGNATAERFNIVINQTLNIYCHEDQEKWPEILPSLMLAYRSSEATQSSQYSPYFLLHRRQCWLPLDVALVLPAGLNSMLTLTTSILIQQITSFTKIHLRIDTLSKGVHGLLNFKLSPTLIEPELLNNTLCSILATLTSDYPEFHIATFDHGCCYETKNVIYTRHNHDLFVTLLVPVTSGSKLYDVYQVITLASPLNQSTNHATQLTNVPPYPTVDQSRNTFTEIAFIQRHTCVGEYRWLCSQFLPQKSVSDKSCISAIFGQDTKAVLSLNCVTLPSMLMASSLIIGIR